MDTQQSRCGNFVKMISWLKHKYAILWTAKRGFPPSSPLSMVVLDHITQDEGPQVPITSVINYAFFVFFFFKYMLLNVF